jgi:hypothetical membrane protein
MTDTPRHLAAIDERPALADLGTQIANPTRTTVRTVVQSIVPALVILNAIALGLVGYLNEQTDLVVPGIVFVWLNLVIAVTSFASGLVARVMATPGLESFLSTHVPWLAALRHR